MTSSSGTVRTVRRRSMARMLDDARARQTGVDEDGAAILRGVSSSSDADAATRRRLAKQIGATEQAVNAWFRSRRVKMKRKRKRRMLLFVLLVLGTARGVYAWNAWHQTAAARRRMEALGQTYKWMTRSGLPRPYPGKMNVERYGRKSFRWRRSASSPPRDERRSDGAHTVDNPKSSPLTKKPETPRQKLERLRVEASKKKMKGRVAPMAQPNRVRESTSHEYTMDASTNILYM